MYKSPKYHQISFYDFNQSCGLQLDETNKWVVLADHMEWEKMEEESGYAKNFPSTTGRPAKPFRMVLGALVIQKHKNLSDRKLVKEIAENPYLQYFIGCGSYQKQCPFKASVTTKPVKIGSSFEAMLLAPVVNRKTTGLAFQDELFPLFFPEIHLNGSYLVHEFCHLA